MSALRVAEQNLRPFFTPKTLAAYLSISERTARQMLADRRITSVRVEGQRRVTPADLEAYLGHPLPPSEAPAAPVAVRSRALPGVGSYDDWPEAERQYAEILTADPCCYCGKPMAAVDHVVPRARGGEHAWTNLTAACRRCNSAKQARSLLTFMLQRAR